MKKYLIAALTFIVVGCANHSNPSIVYCEEVGGTHVLKEGTGYCELPGRTIEAWDLYKAKDRFNKP